jgi:hypothetical protein
VIKRLNAYMKASEKGGLIVRGFDFLQKMNPFQHKTHVVSMAGAMRGQLLPSSPHPIRRDSTCV